MTAAREALQQKLAVLDARLAAFDLPGESRRTLEDPPITPEAHRQPLARHPSYGRPASAPRMHGDTLVPLAGLSGRPRVTGGSPRSRSEALPPPQRFVLATTGVHLLTEGRLPYEVASTILSP